VNGAESYACFEIAFQISLGQLTCIFMVTECISVVCVAFRLKLLSPTLIIFGYIVYVNNVRFNCCVENCPNTFATYSAFANHISKYHSSSNHVEKAMDFKSFHYVVR
jgi:hypothetical protein